MIFSVEGGSRSSSTEPKDHFAGMKDLATRANHRSEQKALQPDRRALRQVRRTAEVKVRRPVASCLIPAELRKNVYHTASQGGGHHAAREIRIDSRRINAHGVQVRQRCFSIRVRN